MRVSVVRDLGAFRALRGEWDALSARSPSADLFTTHDWLDAFWRAFARPGEALTVHVVRQGDRLVAALPLVASADGRTRRQRSLFNFFSGRSDALVDRTEPNAIPALLGHLLATRDSWDVVELSWLPEDSPLFLHLAHAPLPEMSALAVRATESPYLDLEARSFRAFYERQFSAKTRSRDRGHLRDALKTAGSSLEVIERPGDVRGMIDELLAVEHLGWKGDAHSSMKADASVTGFVHDVAARFAGKAELAIVRLTVSGTLAAFVLGFVHGGVFSYYKTSFDPALAELRPGRVVTLRALEYAHERNLRRFDFLGAPDEYKLRYTDRRRPHATVFLHHRGLRSELERALKRTLAPAAKSLLGRPELYPVCVDRRGPTR